jgi:hypothetical protein
VKLSPNSNPAEPGDLLIRLHNQVGAAVDVTGKPYGEKTRWRCHGCGYDSAPITHQLGITRPRANEHANTCRAAYHRLR